MSREEERDRGKGRRGGGHHRHREGEHHGGKGAQTYRRGRIVLFLDQMNNRRATLQRQLTQPEFESIKTILVGELKALEQVIEDYIQLFELHEECGRTEQLEDDQGLLGSEVDEGE
ncbi:hypothetical protein [Paenibacillus xylaniclasticus]|uniref:hypothetical protein n=1 Tax=Paenibacillus xylaniclasticus TaxID=588083 RepID=UPI00157FA792|nr:MULTISPECIES: hypothetical protein [Paenibacillus]GFN31684.1 hypothetical protein PCURB6_19440 [Paenibacillus curdlanolyticus]